MRGFSLNGWGKLRYDIISLIGSGAKIFLIEWLVMTRLPMLNKRQLRVCYWDSEKRITGATKAALEMYLGKLGGVDLVPLNSLNDEAFSPCDLLILTAEHVPAASFGNWLTSMQAKIQRQRDIWTPALIMAQVDFSDLQEIFPWSIKANWYFDIIRADHLESLPIRVANLLRIHDHLHELKRYNEQLRTLDERMKKTEREVLALRMKVKQT